MRFSTGNSYVSIVWVEQPIELCAQVLQTPSHNVWCLGSLLKSSQFEVCSSSALGHLLKGGGFHVLFLIHVPAQLQAPPVLPYLGVPLERLQY